MESKSQLAYSFGEKSLESTHKSCMKSDKVKILKHVKRIFCSIPRNCIFLHLKISL